MGANAGAPNDVVMQTAITREALEWLVKIGRPGISVPLPYEYNAKV